MSNMVLIELSLCANLILVVKHFSFYFILSQVSVKGTLLIHLHLPDLHLTSPVLPMKIEYALSCIIQGGPKKNAPLYQKVVGLAYKYKTTFT